MLTSYAHQLCSPTDLLYVKCAISAPRVGVFHLHAELSAEFTTDLLHHVIL